MEIKDIIQKGDLVFDVGANIGTKSIAFLKQGGKVIAFEPQPVCIDCLRLIPNLVVEPLALSSKEGEEVITEANVNTISSMSDEFIETTHKKRFSSYTWDKKLSVKTDTLDNMIKKYGIPDFVKIDVEGYELEVLKGLTQKVGIISIEFTPELLKNTLSCLDYLAQLGYNSFNYGKGESSIFSFEWIDKEKIVEYLSSVHDYFYEFGDVYAK